MLSQISIKNFKSFFDATSISLGNLTILSGENSSGKSSIYQAYLALIQTITLSNHKFKKVRKDIELPILNSYGEYIKLGTNRDIVNSKSDSFIIGLDFDNQVYSFEFSDFKDKMLLTKYAVHGIRDNKECSFSYEYDRNSNKMRVSADSALSIMSFDFEKVFLKFMSQEIGISNKSSNTIYSQHVEFDDVQNFSFYGGFSFSFEIPIENIACILEEKYRDIFDYNKFKDFLAKEASYFDEKNVLLYLDKDFGFIGINKPIYIPPFRGNPERYYDFFDKYYNDYFAIDKQKRINYCIENGKKIKGSLEEGIKYWAGKILGIDNIEINTYEEDVISSILIVSDGKKVPINCVGFGISQALPVIIKVLSSNNKICVIDEPEIHLHPHAQTRMAEFFDIMVQLGKQIIIETHSEYIINYFIYRSLLNTDLKYELYWVSSDCNHLSRITKIEYDDLGYILNKPDGFADGLDEIAEKFLELRMEKINNGTSHNSI